MTNTLFSELIIDLTKGTAVGVVPGPYWPVEELPNYAAGGGMLISEFTTLFEGQKLNGLAIMYGIDAGRFEARTSSGDERRPFLALAGTANVTDTTIICETLPEETDAKIYLDDEIIFAGTRCVRTNSDDILDQGMIEYLSEMFGSDLPTVMIYGKSGVARIDAPEGPTYVYYSNGWRTIRGKH